MSFILEPDIQVSCGPHNTRILHKPTGKIFACGLKCYELGYNKKTQDLIPKHLDTLQQVIIPSKIEYISSEYHGFVAFDTNGCRHEWINPESEGHEDITLSPEMKSFVSDRYLQSTISYGICYKLFLCKDNKLYIRGDNEYMGVRSEEDLKLIKFSDYSDDVKIIQIASASCHSFVLRTDGLYSWGRNFSGVLGLGDESHYTMPTKINSLNVISISISANHVMASDNNGDVWGWGSNEWGQLGLGDTDDRSLPTKLGIQKIVSVVCGVRYTMALDANGTLHGWGANEHGQLGLGDIFDRRLPEKIRIKNIISVTCSIAHTIAVDIKSKIHGWGRNDCGQLGLGDYDDRYLPQSFKLKL